MTPALPAAMARRPLREAGNLARMRQLARHCPLDEAGRLG